MSNINETSPLINNDSAVDHYTNNKNETEEAHHFHVTLYKRRWWILAVFSLGSLTQSMQWNTWAPINFAVEIAFGWDDTVTALIQGISNGGFIIVAFPLMFLVEVYGIRPILIACTSCMSLCMVCWIFALVYKMTWLVYIGGILGGAAGTVFMSAPALLSNLWFPVSERFTATAIGAGSAYIGTGLAFVAGPFISGANVTAADVNSSATLPEEFKAELQGGILNVMYFVTGVAALHFILVVLYFPSKPAHPPSKTASIERVDYKQGMASLVRNVPFWLLNFAFNVPNGSFNSWVPLISISFKPMGISEVTAGWLGFSSICVSCVTSIVVSMFADHFKKKVKLILLAASAGSIVCLLIIVCIQEKYIIVPKESIDAVLYVTVIASAVCINGVIPLYYELGCEIAYPVHEGLTCVTMTVANNVFGMTYFLLFLSKELASTVIFVLMILTGISINGVCPLYYELGCEISYPVHEGLTCVMMVQMNTFISMVYFLLFLVPSLANNPQWMAWVCFIGAVIGLPLLAVVKTSFSRLDLEDDSDSANEKEAIVK